MKQKLKLLIGLVLVSNLSFAQKSKLAVVQFETNIDATSNAQLSSFAYNFMQFYGQAYTVVGMQEVQSAYNTLNLNPSTCGAACRNQIAKEVNADYVLSGSVNQMAGSIFITVNMQSATDLADYKTAKMEFLNLPTKTDHMLKLTLQKLLGLPQSQELLESFTNEHMVQSAKNPDVNAATLSLSGPRLGYTVFTGEAAKTLQRAKINGGYDVAPAMFTLGYQFEQQYLDGGTYQGLFEFIPQITGLDQGMFLPSFTVINGLRNNKSGLEFGFGPTFFVSKKTDMYQDGNGDWYRPRDRQNINNIPTESRMDSRGTPKLQASLVFAVGKSFKAGNLNIPVNAFIVPSKDDYRFGISVGYNFNKG